MYLKIQPGKEQYASLAELALGHGHLDKFIVTHRSDVELLKKIRRNISCGNRDCGIYQISERGAKDKYQTPPPPEGVETITSVLNIENAMVFNYLVDNVKIDETALAESKETSERALLVTDGNGRESMRGKVKKVFFLPDGDHWEAKGGQRTMIANDRQLKQTIGVDHSRAIETAKHELKAVEKELSRARKEEEDVKEALLQVRYCSFDTANGVLWPSCLIPLLCSRRKKHGINPQKSTGT